MKLPFVLALLCPLFFSAQVSQEYIDAKVDSAFDYVYLGNGSADAKRIALELLEIDKNQGSFTAKVNALQVLGEIHYYTANTDSALFWYRQANDYAHAENDSSEIAYTAISIASIHEQLNEFEPALAGFNQAIDIRLAMNDTSEYVFALARRAWLYLQSDRHTLAAKDFLHGSEVSLAYGDSAMYASHLNGLANVHKKQGNYEMSQEVFLTSIATSEAIGDEFAANGARGNLAMVYKSTGDYDKAYAIYPGLLEFYTEQQYTEGQMFCYANMAVISQLQGEATRSLAEAEEAIVRSQQVGRKDTESDMLGTMAKCMLDLGQPTEALKLAQEARRIAYDGFFIEKQRDAEQTLSEAYTQLEQPGQALFHYKAFTALKDSLLNVEKSKQILELQTLYETAQTEAENARTQAENAELRAENEVASTRQTALLVGLLVVLLLSAVIINREVQRRKKARALHDSEMKLAQSEQDRLHDQLEFKNRELASQALHLAQKNEMLQDIQQDLKQVQTQSEDADVGGVIRKLNFEAQLDKNWDQFLQTFTQTNDSFFQDLTARYGKLSKNEMRLAALLKMNLSSKDIASILNISDEGVKKARYRLRKKMGLESSESLENALMGLQTA